MLQQRLCRAPEATTAGRPIKATAPHLDEVLPLRPIHVFAMKLLDGHLLHLQGGEGEAGEEGSPGTQDSQLGRRPGSSNL